MSGEYQHRKIMQRIDSSGGPHQCHPWTGWVNEAGYGRARIQGRNTYIGRYLLARHLGRSLGRFEFACHSCDNPTCCNITHLFLGSPRDNVIDCINKGRAHFHKHSNKTHCKHNHELIKENTRYYGKKKLLRCATCHASSNKKARDKRRQERKAASD